MARFLCVLFFFLGLPRGSPACPPGRPGSDSSSGSCTDSHRREAPRYSHPFSRCLLCPLFTGVHSPAGHLVCQITPTHHYPLLSAQQSSRGTPPQCRHRPPLHLRVRKTRPSGKTPAQAWWPRSVLEPQSLQAQPPLRDRTSSPHKAHPEAGGPATPATTLCPQGHLCRSTPHAGSPLLKNSRPAHIPFLPTPFLTSPTCKHTPEVQLSLNCCARLQWERHFVPRLTEQPQTGLEVTPSCLKKWSGRALAHTGFLAPQKRPYSPLGQRN